MISWFGDRAVPPVGAILCDADGTLFPSEEPAYEASTAVTNRFLAHLGADRTYEPSELQGLTNGQNFRSAAGTLADLHGGHLDQDDLEHWVTVERDVVTSHLSTVLVPDPDVSLPVADLSRRFALAIVTSSATTRLNTCLRVTRLEQFFDPSWRFSAENSLPRPTSKPDPAVYAFACEQLGLEPGETIAVEDSVNGALSAAAAGCWTIGTVQFVPADQRRARVDALRQAGVVAAVESWQDIVDLLQHAQALDTSARHGGVGA